jgi:cell division protein FtsI/penicillin-binding protein 2
MYKHQAIFNLYSTVKNITDVDGVPVATDESGNEVSIDMSTVNTEATELENTKTNLKASAKAKLIAGEALTEEEADTIVL